MLGRLVALMFGSPTEVGRVALRGKFPDAVPLSSPLDLDADNKAPTEFRIFRAGVNTSDKGDFLFDADAARSVMDAFAKKGTALTMDYEHQAASDPPIIAIASASSWVPEIRDGELWAKSVNWTDKARGHIEAREYTRFSPLFLHEKKFLRVDGKQVRRVTRIINCALTNVEALDDVQPLVAASAGGKSTMKPMNCKACAKALKAPTDEDEGDEVMCTACGGMKKMLTAVGLRVDMNEGEAISELTALSSFRGTIFVVTGKSTVAEALGVLHAWKANDAETTALRARIAEIEEKGLRVEFDGIIDGAIKSAKVTPAEKDGLIALTLGASGKVTTQAIAQLTAYLGTRGALVRTTPTPEKKTGAGNLTDADVTVARMLGNNPDDVVKFKDGLASQ